MPPSGRAGTDSDFHDGTTAMKRVGPQWLGAPGAGPGAAAAELVDFELMNYSSRPHLSGRWSQIGVELGRRSDFLQRGDGKRDPAHGVGSPDCQRLGRVEGPAEGLVRPVRALHIVYI